MRRPAYAWRTMARAADSVRSHFRGMGEALASLAFPAPCRICARILDTGSPIPFCRACTQALTQTLPEPLCAQCGRPIVSAAAAEGKSLPRCHLCRSQVYAFDFARSFGACTPRMSRAILLLKYGNVAPVGGWFAGRLADLVEREPELFPADAVEPVPLDRGQLRERGYNQAELIAKPLARLLGIPFRSYLLVRTRPRPNQLRLTRRERWETVRGAYATHKTAQVDKLLVLLVDDVFTTGATLDACSRALRGAGALRVAGITVARALPSLVVPDAPVTDQDQAE
jgi:ComF family protein